MPRSSDEIFIWIPRKYIDSRYKILIDGLDRRADIITCSFTKAVAPEMGTFKIILNNNNKSFSDLYKGGEDVELQYDFSLGTTRVFLGTIEEAKDVFGRNGETLEIIGSHLGGELLNRTVIASYDGSLSGDEVIKNLISRFAPSGWTTNNVEACAIFPKADFNAVPLWKSLSDVTKICNYDLYGDDSRDIHFFAKGSKNNDNEAVVLSQNLITLKGFGKDTLDLRSKVQVYGSDDQGVPVIYSSTDTTQKVTREHVIFNNNVRDSQAAEDLANSRQEAFSRNDELGEGRSLLLPTLNPGDMVYLSNTLAEINARQRFVKFTHSLPDESTDFIIEDVRSMSKLFRERIEQDLQNESISNPFNLDFSYNFTFDNESLFDTQASTNVKAAEGALKLQSGSSGTLISLPKNTEVNVTQVHVKAVGDGLENVSWLVSADNGNHFEPVILEELKSLGFPGKNLRLKAVISASGVRVDSAVVIYK